jgi:heat shock protein HslJ
MTMRNVIKMTWAGLRGAVAMIGLASCGGAMNGTATPSDFLPSGAERDLATLQGSWALVSLQEAGSEAAPVPERRFFADFGPDQDLFIKVDCNVCTAGYTAALDGSVEVVGPIPCTLAYCATAPLDTRYLALLEGVRSWSVSDGRLELSSPGGVLLFDRSED